MSSNKVDVSKLMELLDDTLGEGSSDLQEVDVENFLNLVINTIPDEYVGKLSLDSTLRMADAGIKFTAKELKPVEMALIGGISFRLSGSVPVHSKIDLINHVFKLMTIICHMHILSTRLSFFYIGEVSLGAYAREEGEKAIGALKNILIKKFDCIWDDVLKLVVELQVVSYATLKNKNDGNNFPATSIKGITQLLEREEGC